ncbi:glycoside hydrolase superfamily [Microdochium trichocladiopsis]|uniref:Glycoside hydrolase superfamily n=1 Tax=Microdochium trichocladiopsis TaxID=1682393 RepID=A0A9P9BP02_9PEZI|nr:glycoside hydrolase superfamily [Microdochium trichocladiopsis]KAH7028752.1 glycoside hydrolase superfamily [Microdochium trichocladiopsis]
MVDDLHHQWNDFKAMTGVKRVISFGGWVFSNEETYDVLRKAMGPANRKLFANNVVAFLNREGLDGVDWDWEYPGATDIPGTPPGSTSDGPNYLKFVTLMKTKLGGKTQSIAAPSSYWYLKNFPIAQMGLALDDIVFMTYDLHSMCD